VPTWARSTAPKSEKDTVTRITDRVIEELQAWWARPLEQSYAAIFIDAIMARVRDGQVRNRPVYAVSGARAAPRVGGGRSSWLAVGPAGLAGVVLGR
jgi:transposase-like protein